MTTTRAQRETTDGIPLLVSVAMVKYLYHRACILWAAMPANESRYVEELLRSTGRHDSLNVRYSELSALCDLLSSELSADRRNYALALAEATR